MLRFATPTLLLLLAFGLQLRCTTLVDQIFTPPEVSVERVQLQDIALSGVTFLITVGVDNPNAVGIDVKNFKYRFDVDGQQLAEGINARPSSIRRRGKSMVDLTVKVGYSGLRRGVVGVLTRTELPYQFRGELVLESPVGTLGFPLQHAGIIPVPRPPELSVQRVSLDQFSLTSTTLTFHLGVKSRENLDLLFRHLNYQVAINGHDIARSTQQVQQTLRPGVEYTLPLSINFRPLGLGSSIVTAVRRLEFRYRLNLDLNLDSNYGTYALNYLRENNTADLPTEGAVSLSTAPAP